MLTTEEKIQLWEWVAQYAAPEKLLIAGTGVESVRETVALTNQAADIGYKVAMVRTPHYYKNLINNAAAQMLYFRAVADQVKIPIFIYNWPQVTGVDIPAEAVAELSHHPNIIAIKESSGNLEKVMRMIREVKPGFQVLTGSAPTLAPSFAVGCSGAVLAFANAAPYATVSIWEAHRTREPEAALDWQNRISHAAYLGNNQAWRTGLEVRDGSRRLLWRPAETTADGALSGGEEGNRRSLRRLARLIFYFPPIASTTASVTSAVRLFPPTSAVRTFPSANTFATARSTAWPASSRPR